MKHTFKVLSFAVAILCSTMLMAQSTITGTVIDADTNTPLPGANIVEKGTKNGTSTDFDGNFSLTSQNDSGHVVVTFVGYGALTVPFKSGQNLGNIVLSATNSLDEIVVTGSGVIDLAKERETPVAVSTIRAIEIQNKVGNLEFPEILNTTPSVYATKQGGGYGDSRINVRGFDQRNTAIIINGQPVNDMENGWVYWSNWAGLTDIASGMQVQRGLGASKLAVPSVGGTITIVTKSTDKEEGGFASTTFGNDAFLKTVVGYNTGLNEKGWASSLLLGHWNGDGYVDGTKGEGSTYLFSLGYKPSDIHTFNFTFTGAGQWHHQRDTFLSIRDHINYGGDNFRKFNSDWGLKEGEEYSLRRNFYNKPIATFNWDYNINSKLSISTSVYGSWGRGGGTGARGRNFGITQFNKDLTKAIADGDLPYRKADGTIDFDAVVANNKAGLPYNEPKSPYAKESIYQGKIIGTNTDNKPNNSINENVAIRRSSMNSHNWYGAISNLKYETDNWTYGIGIDLRAYKGQHYRVLNDLLGLDGYWSTGNQNLINGIILTETVPASPYRNTGLTSDKIDYYNLGIVNWGGLNGIIEYNDHEKISAVLQGGLSNQGYKRVDYFDQPNNVESDVKNILGGYVKGGLNYNLNEKHNVFFNAGYIARQPNFDAVFVNFSNRINKDVKNETITSMELGYGFKSGPTRINVNLYNTLWANRVVSRTYTAFFGANMDGTGVFDNLKQLHQGIELEGRTNILDNLKVNAMISIGNWRYKEAANGTVTEVGNTNNVSTTTLYLKDVKVGDAAQTTTFVGLNYTPVENFFIDLGWRYAADLYADFSVIDKSFDSPDNKGSLKLPNYNLFDLGLGYKFNFNNSNLAINANINNVLDTEYISEANSNIHATDSSKLYKGIDDTNTVWFGFGRTWNLTLRYNF